MDWCQAFEAHLDQRINLNNTPPPPLQVTSLPPLPSLRYLNLNNCRIVSEALAQALIHTPDLEALYVAKTQIDTLVFAALRHVPRLKRLSLAACDGLLTSPDAVRSCRCTAATRCSPRFVYCSSRATSPSLPRPPPPAARRQ